MAKFVIFSESRSKFAWYTLYTTHKKVVYNVYQKFARGVDKRIINILKYDNFVQKQNCVIL